VQWHTTFPASKARSTAQDWSSCGDSASRRNLMHQIALWTSGGTVLVWKMEVCSARPDVCRRCRFYTPAVCSATSSSFCRLRALTARADVVCSPVARCLQAVPLQLRTTWYPATYSAKKPSLLWSYDRSFRSIVLQTAPCVARLECLVAAGNAGAPRLLCGAGDVGRMWPERVQRGISAKNKQWTVCV
jgi:hypothetical protein